LQILLPDNNSVFPHPPASSRDVQLFPRESSRKDSLSLLFVNFFLVFFLKDLTDFDILYNYKIFSQIWSQYELGRYQPM
jgi:hypothetical protein